MKLFKGGAKLKNPQNQGFKPIIDMLSNPNCNLDLLSINSSVGFVYSFTIPPEYSEYLGFNNSTSEFDIPITDFVLKIAIIKKKNLDLKR